MWCRNVRSQLSAFADGELTPAMTQQVRDHLAGCEHCTREHTSLRSLATLTAAIPFEEVPGSLHARILASLNQAAVTPEPMPVRIHRRPAPPMWAWGAFATGVIVVACGALQQRPGHTPARPIDISTAGIAPVPPVAGEATPRKSVSVGVPPHSEQNTASPSAPESTQETQAIAAAEPSSTTDLQPASGAVEQSLGAPASKPMADRTASVLPTTSTERPQPAVVNSSGKLATEPRVSEPSVPLTAPMMARENLMAVPGDPIVNNTGPLGPPEPVAAVEKDPTMRMVGMAMETESPGEEDEGLRSFRMFLQENSRSVPQPPAAIPGRERRMRKSL